MKTRKNIILVGDRILVEPDENTGKSAAGLYLPPTIKEKEKVRGGTVVKKGPGYPVHDPSAGEEPWAERKSPVKYVPLEAAEGDYALFLRHEAIEIEFEGKKYVIVPHSSILALVRTEIVE